MKNPIKYIRQPEPKPTIPIRIAIVGPPKSGKTTGKYVFTLSWRGQDFKVGFLGRGRWIHYCSE